MDCSDPRFKQPDIKRNKSVVAVGLNVRLLLIPGVFEKTCTHEKHMRNVLDVLHFGL